MEENNNPLNLCSIDIGEDGNIRISGKNKEHCKKLLGNISFED